MKENTLNNVIKQLENKGYIVEYDFTNTVLEIEKESVIIDVTPYLVDDGKIEDVTIDKIINENIESMCFEFYGYTLNFPNASELIKEIEESF